MRGYLVVLGGVAIFLAICMIVCSGAPKQAAVEGLVPCSLGLLAMSLWIGTAMIAAEKGYHLGIGVLLGLLGPLGLLIITLIPDRH